MSMTKEQNNKCAAIIHSAAATAATVSGFSAQIPCADNTALVAIEVTMICGLGKVFNKAITKGMASGMLASQAGTVLGRCTSQLLIGWIPIAGNITNAATSAAVVEGLGWSFAEVFAKEYELTHSKEVA